MLTEPTVYNTSSDITPINAVARMEEKFQRVRSLSPTVLSPVFHLPSEVLTIIFTHGARDYYESDNGGYFIPCIPAWVNISYVCSHWRNVALNFPTLWTYHFNVSLRWTEELLLRSKETSLKISCFSRRSEDLSRWTSLLNKLLEHSKRIQELRLDVPLLFLPDQLSLCVARLEKLDISLQWGIPKQPITITDGDKLPLRTLKLDNCSLPWYSFNLRGLTELVLLYVPSPSPLNMAEFLTILSNMQNLTLLRLEDVLPSARDFLSSGGPDIFPKINLPHLALFAISAPLSAIVALLSCVSFPPRTRLGLELLVEPGSSVSDYSPISSFLAQQFSAREQSHGPMFRSLVLHAGYSLTFSSLERDCHSSSLFDDMDYNVPLDITLGEDDEETDETELALSDIHCIMGNICRSLPLGNVQSLFVSDSHSLSSDAWREMLRCLHGLRYMKLAHGWMPDLTMLSLIDTKVGENSDGEPTEDSTLDHILVPKLEELELEHIAFTHGQSHMSQMSLLDTLSTRDGLRDRLTMTNCNSTS